MSAEAKPPIDPYEEEPELEEVPPERAETLMEQARDYHKYLTHMKESLSSARSTTTSSPPSGTDPSTQAQAVEAVRELRGSH